MSFTSLMPNRVDIVQQVRDQRPDLWAATNLDPGAKGFIIEVIRRLHAIDARFGGNGKRQTTELSSDVVAFLNPTIEPTLPSERSCEAADVIGAHGDIVTARPIWNPITVQIADGGSGSLWIDPVSFGPSPIPPAPQPPAAPPAAPRKKIRVKTAHGTYLRAGDTGEINQTTVATGPWEVFEIEEVN